MPGRRGLNQASDVKKLGLDTALIDHVVVRDGAVRLSGFLSIVVADALLILRRDSEQDCCVEPLHALLDRVGVDFIFNLRKG